VILPSREVFISVSLKESLSGISKIRLAKMGNNAILLTARSIYDSFNLSWPVLVTFYIFLGLLKTHTRGEPHMTTPDTERDFSPGPRFEGGNFSRSWEF